MNKSFLFLLAFTVLLSSCKKNVTALESFDNIPKQLDFDYLKVKSKLEYTDQKQKNKATLHIRIKNDSIIWVSIQSTIEAFRIKIEQDSFHVMDRLKKVYAAYSYKELEKKVGFELDYNFFESLITANIPQGIIEEGKMLKRDSMSYILHKRGYYQFEYFVSSSLGHIEMIRVSEIPTNNSLEIDYSNYVSSGKTIYPSEVFAKMIYLSDKNFSTSDISIRHSSFEVVNSDEKLSFPFNVPEKYARN